LGTFCKELGIDHALIGKIDVTDTHTYIALHHTIATKVMRALKHTKIKKKRYAAWILG
jgi:ATP-independent RNA helicase DbpA